ncbi:MAG: calcium/sodium antiporter [Coriobacteriia bacterium]|nr:calcium/sodium antiporter [Coriobacteriia bacterium]
MLTHSLYILGGMVLLALGAEGLVRGSTGLALRLGITSLVIGLTVVAFGTGSPELVLSIRAAAAGNGGIALGNVVGSNISNICLVLGVAALLKPMHVRSELIRREMPIMIAVTVMLIAMLIDGTLSRLDGGVLVASAVAYTVLSYVMAKRGDTRQVEAEFDAAVANDARPVWQDALMLSIGLVALLIGASMLLKGAVFIAEGLGVSQVVIGLTVIAIGTSLPEMATSVSSALRGEADVAFGNVIGSNVLNILAVLGVAALIRPIAVQGLSSIDLAVMVASAALVLPIMWRGSILNRWEGALLLTGYVVYVGSLIGKSF